MNTWSRFPHALRQYSGWSRKTEGSSPRLVTKEDLIEKVWAGAFIEESNITKSVAEIRRNPPARL